MGYPVYKNPVHMSLASFKKICYQFIGIIRSVDILQKYNVLRLPKST